MYHLYDSNSATVEPITVSELKAHLRITGTDHDDMLEAIIPVARSRAELFTKRYLRVGATAKAAIYRLYLDKFPKIIQIYQAPVVEISSIYYYNSGGVLTLLDPAEYNTDIISEPARIAEAYSKSWPTIRDRIHSVYVQFTSGYQLAASVPDQIKQGILMIAAHLFENPSDVVTGTQVNSIPQSSEWLLTDFRLNRI